MKLARLKKKHYIYRYPADNKPSLDDIILSMIQLLGCFFLNQAENHCRSYGRQNAVFALSFLLPACVVPCPKASHNLSRSKHILP
jgi:hypothetical protein